MRVKYEKAQNNLVMPHFFDVLYGCVEVDGFVEHAVK